jgi:hypothetical protein
MPKLILAQGVPSPPQAASSVPFCPSTWMMNEQLCCAKELNVVVAIKKRENRSSVFFMVVLLYAANIHICCYS